MPRVIEQEATTFNDYVIVPGTSPLDIRPNHRSTDEYDLSTTLGDIELKTPIIAANMTAVVSTESTVDAFIKAGVTPILHQFAPLEERVTIIEKIMKDTISVDKYPYASIQEDGRGVVGAAVSFDNSLKQVQELVEAGAVLIVFDSANGYTRSFQESIEKIKDIKDSRYGDRITLVAGNVATPEGVEELYFAGADAVKVGIGPGFGCGTGPETGVHMPQMTALVESYNLAESIGVDIIADGGIKKPSNLHKALLFSNAAMMGSVFAATLESSAVKITGPESEIYANYKGSASNEARRERLEKYTDTFSLKEYESLVPEGYDGLIRVEGTVEEVVKKYLATLARAMYYVGVDNLVDYRQYGVLQKISQASREELRDKVTGKDLYKIQPVKK